MTNISMKHLRYFASLASELHFGRAADKCAVSQPALSLQIKELEDTLGAPLVERAPRRIRLTPLGADVAARAREILRSVDDITDLARASNGMSGDLRIGVIPTVAPYLLPRIIRTLTDAAPSLRPLPREAVTEKLIRALHTGDLDVAVVALPLSEAGLTEHPMFDEDFVLIRHISDAHRPAPKASDLGEMRLLLLEEGHCFRDQALSFCNINPHSTRHMMQGSSLSTLVQMVGSGIGVTLIPRMAVALETRTAEVTACELPHPRPMRTIGMVWRTSSPMDAQYRAIADLIRTVATCSRNP